MTLFEMYQFADMMYKENLSPYKQEKDRTETEKFWRQVRKDVRIALENEIIEFYAKYKKNNGNKRSNDT
jgi:hypothetical protein